MTKTTTWNQQNVNELYDLPFFELISQAHAVHKQHFKADVVEVCTLLNFKTGACPENCGYCAQSGHFKTSLKKENMYSLEQVLEAAKEAKANGITRFCMGAAWRSPSEKDLPKVIEMIKEVKKLGLETCVTLGMLNEQQAHALKEAGLDYYNHNLDTSPEHYQNVVTTRTYEDRLNTLEEVRKADINVCCGGILGLGETRADRVSFFLQLANLPEAPKSIPINRLFRIKNTPLENAEPVDDFEFIRAIAVARIMFPKSMVRLSAGRDSMNETMQAWCFYAGANSIHHGEKLLTIPNAGIDQDQVLFEKLGLKKLQPWEKANSECSVHDKSSSQSQCSMS